VKNFLEKVFRSPIALRLSAKDAKYAKRGREFTTGLPNSAYFTFLGILSAQLRSGLFIETTLPRTFFFARATTGQQRREVGPSRQGRKTVAGGRAGRRGATTGEQYPEIARTPKGCQQGC
jgi:hypothetical protein